MRLNFKSMLYWSIVHLVGGTWESWSEWTPCSVSCGSGVVSRKRNCLDETTRSNECKENASEIHSCTLSGCFEAIVERQEDGTFIGKIKLPSVIAAAIGVPLALITIAIGVFACFIKYRKRNHETGRGRGTDIIARLSDGSRTRTGYGDHVALDVLSGGIDERMTDVQGGSR